MLLFTDYVVEQKAGGIRQHQAADAVDDHEDESERQEFAARQDRFAEVGPDFFDAFGLRALGRRAFVARMFAGGCSFGGSGVHCNFSVA